MARPIKEGADYFPHDVHLRNDNRILAVRRKYGIEGYALYCLLLETAAGLEGFDLKISFPKILSEEISLEIELLSGEFGVDPQRLQEILKYFSFLGLIKPSEEGTIFIPYLKERLEPLEQKRRRQREYLARQRDRGVSNEVKDDTNSIKDVDNSESDELEASLSTQSKVKESRVEESIISIKEIKKEREEAFAFFWEHYPIKKDKASALKAFEKKYAKDGNIAQTMVHAIQEQEKERTERSAAGDFVPEWKYPATWINKESWKDEPLKVNTATNGKTQSTSIGKVSSNDWHTDYEV
jgi:hypothetical protein